jgi:aquaporin Z
MGNMEQTGRSPNFVAQKLGSVPSVPGFPLIHLVGIPVTNTSVNPARSTGPAIFVGGWALQQLWLFWVAPLIGGALGGGIYRALFSEA